MASKAAAPSKMAMPITLPAAQRPPPKTPMDLAASRPGMTSENAHAASMTPAPKPNSVSCTRSDSRCENITGTVPKAVAMAAMEPPTNACMITGLALASSHVWVTTQTPPAIRNPSAMRSRMERGRRAVCAEVWSSI